MQRKRSRLALVGVLALSVTAGLAVEDVAAKKKKKGGNTATVTNATPRAIPDALMADPFTFGKLDTVFTIGNKFKGKQVAANSISVTFQTTGTGADAADDLTFRLISPAGRKETLTGSGVGDQNLGPLTVTPNSAVDLCDDPTPPCADPDASLNRPFFGTAGDEDLAVFTGVPMVGNWTLRVLDTDGTPAGLTSILNSATLMITGVPKPITTLPRR